MFKIDKNKWQKECIEWIKCFVFAFLLAVLLMKFVVFFAIVPTGSMIPTINEGDRIIVWRIFRYFDWEHRGLSYNDLVVFYFEDDNVDRKLLVKRVIGLPGDKIKIDNGIVYRNNEIIEEDYVKNKDTYSMEEIEVPENEIFVLGDNRQHSYDARYWKNKTVPFKDVVGEVKLLNK